MHCIQQHTFGLTRYTYMLLSSLCHGNSRPVAQIYTEGQFESPSTQGPILNFNLVDSHGQIIGYSQVNWTNKINYCVVIILTTPKNMNALLLSLGGQNGQFVQHPSPHRLFLQHWCLPVLPWDNQSADEEKCTGKTIVFLKVLVIWRPTLRMYYPFFLWCVICTKNTFENVSRNHNKVIKENY